MPGLGNYWHFNGQDWRDLITGNDVINCENALTAVDRFGRPDSALYLNNGYCAVKPGVYFDGSDYTISGWIKPIVFVGWDRLLEFSNGPNTEIVDVSYDSGNNQIVISEIYFYNISKVQLISTKAIKADEWTHIATTLNSTHLTLYLNGTYSNSIENSLRPLNVNRTICTFGQNSWWPGYPSNAVFDDIRIYNRALSDQEIIDEMNSKF